MGDSMNTDVPMKEFLLWANCPNNCQFCWQKKLANEEMILTESEKLLAIAAVKKEISVLPYSDILIVGGEVYSSHSDEVNVALADLFAYIRQRIDEGLTRLMYANSNLIYADRTVLRSLLTAFSGAEDKLRFTTSYDVYGRYANDDAKAMFFDNLAWIKETYPNVHPVVNTILTKQMCELISSGGYMMRDMYNRYGLAFINLIPYIAIEKGDIMFPTWKDITEALVRVEAQEPHYLRYYVQQLDFQQDRVLKEYHKSEGFVECTASYSDCGHNGNYARATEDGECFVCKLKRTIAVEMKTEGFDEVIRAHTGPIVTIGDVSSYNVWTKYRQPDIVVFDCSSEEADVLNLVRSSNTHRIIAVNDSQFLSEELEDAIHTAFNYGDKVAVQVIGEEDSALFPAIRSAEKGTMIIVGDVYEGTMRYMVTQTDPVGKNRD